MIAALCLPFVCALGLATLAGPIARRAGPNVGATTLVVAALAVAVVADTPSVS